MITKKDIQKIVEKSHKRLHEEISSFKGEVKIEFTALRKEFKEEIETAVAQVIEAVMKHTASKEDLKRVEDRLANVEIGVIDVKRSINDLKADIPTPQEFDDHEKRITKLEAIYPQ